MSESHEVPAGMQSERLWLQMRERWANGGPIRVEEWFTPAELTSCDDQLLVDLLYCEFCLRAESGESPTLDEYLARFPTLELPLRRQFVVHLGFTDALAGSSNDARETEVATASRGHAVHLPLAVGKYRVIEKLGSGAQADVYRAVHPVLRREVVVKLCRHRLEDGSTRGDRLLIEGRSLAQLRHPNLVQVYDIAFEEGRPYLVMEYVPGESLEQHARRAIVPPRTAALLVAKIAWAVGAAHQKGITHRDIKPANVLIDGGGEPRLLDFGLSQIADVGNVADGPESGISGTLGYMAPEQACGETAAVDHRSDIFALGGILYFLLVGRAPFVGDSFTAVLGQSRDCCWDRAALRRSGAPRQLRAICETAMAPVKDDRYPNAEQLASDLEAFASRGGIGRRRLLAATAVVVAVAAAAPILKPLPPIGRSGKSPEDSRDAETARKPTDLLPPNGTPTLAVRVWRGSRLFDLVDVVPVQTGDEFQITAEVPAGVHPAIFLVNGVGEMRLLVAAGEASRALRYPVEEDHAVPLTGPPGTEFLFICGRRSAPVEPERIARAWAEPAAWPALPELCVLQFFGDGFHVLQQSRDFGPPVPRPDPEADVRRRLESFWKRVQAEIDYIKGLVYFHREGS